MRAAWVGHLWSGRAPGRPGEPFRAIQGAHDTGANPNETRVSFLRSAFCFNFLLSGLAWGWLSQLAYLNIFRNSIQNKVAGERVHFSKF